MAIDRFTAPRAALPALMLALFTACTAPGDDAAAGAAASAADTRDTSATWTVRPDGIGPLVAGMRVADAMEVLPGSLSVPVGALPEACTYAVWDSAPPGVRVMVEDGTVTRIDVTAGDVATAEGARVGDSEARIDSLYAGRIEHRPHKYAVGQYFIVRARTDTARPLPEVTEPGATPPNTRRDFRLVFETDGQRVTRYRAGLFPAVEYVEGCG